MRTGLSGHAAAVSLLCTTCAHHASLACIAQGKVLSHPPRAFRARLTDAHRARHALNHLLHRSAILLRHPASWCRG